MKEDVEKILWMVLIGILLLSVIEIHLLFLIPLTIYSVFMGAKFRGKNWFLGWNRVIELNEKVK